MGIGHDKLRFKQFKLFAPSSNRFSYGGMLRQKRNGRQQRPLSCKEPIHLVFKINKTSLKSKSLRQYQSFKLVHMVLKKYSYRFSVHIEQLSIQNDHIHLLIRTRRRSLYHHFFRVVAGQIAQKFESYDLLKTDVIKPAKLWKHRPFTRVVRGFKAYRVVRDYIQLNEKEILGLIPYRKARLRGLTAEEWATLWK